MKQVDELCSIVGTVHSELIYGVDNVSDYGNLPEYLLEVMSRLFDIGSHIAKPRRHDDKASDAFSSENTVTLEHWIDEFTEELPELLSFILPTGGKASASLHVSRCVCRRAERQMVSLMTNDIHYDPDALKYLNRLSDFLFTAARWTNYCEGKEEIQYRKPHISNSKQRKRYVVALSENEDKMK